MRRFTQILLILTLLIGIARAVLFGVYIGNRYALPIEVHHLESKMVHLAWRVQHGVRLYPDWQSYPHVANFFGPLYFGLVGAIGAILDSTLANLYLVGRAVTVSSIVAASILLFEALRSRYGLFAAIFGAIQTLGVGPLFGFGLMVRPDALSDFLGLAGFLVLIGLRRRPPGVPPPRSSQILAGLLIAGAILAKQTTAVYALAAALALALEGRPRIAATWLAIVLGTLAVLAAGITLLYEPNFGPALLAESRTPWNLQGWTFSLWRIMVLDPEFLLLLLVGIALWATSSRVETAPIALSVVLAGTSVITLAKYGSDMNYFLGIRHVAAWSAAMFWYVAWSPSPSRPRIAGVLVSTLMMMGLLDFSMMHASVQADLAASLRKFNNSPPGQALQSAYEQIFAVAEDPQSRLLTDSGIIDIRQGERTVFGDPWLFRMLAETGQLHLETMRRRIETETYNQLITTKAIDDPTYETYDFGLPMPLIEAARQHYVLLGIDAGLFFYKPRREILPPLTPAATETSATPGVSP